MKSSLRRWTIVMFSLSIAAAALCFWGLKWHEEQQNKENVVNKPKNNGLVDSNKLIEKINPDSATAQDWENAKVRLGNVIFDDNKIDYALLTHLRPILEVDKNTAAWHLRVDCERSSDNSIKTRIWGHKAYTTIQFESKTGKISKLPPKQSDDGIELGEKPGIPVGRVSIIFGTMPANRSIKCIGISTSLKDEPWHEIEIPFDYSGYTGLFAYGTMDYPIAILPKCEKATKRPSSLIFLDIRAGIMLGEINLPTEAMGTRPNFGIDRTNNVIFACGFDVDWLMAIDLHPYFLKKYPNGLSAAPGK